MFEIGEKVYLGDEIGLIGFVTGINWKASRFEVTYKSILRESKQ